MQQPLELIDYLFNRYAYLGVPENADKATIREAVRIGRARNHSDKLEFVSDEIRKVAEVARGLIDECARVLLDDELRAVYDERLAEFRAKTPHLISDSGTPILDPTRFRIDLDELLRDEAMDPSYLTQRVAAMSGYDARRLNRARARFAKDPQDWALREELRAELTTCFCYYTVLEDVYWERAGVRGGTVKGEHDRAQDVDAFTQRLQERLDEVRAHALETIEYQSGLSALGFVPPLLLAYDNAGEGAGSTADTQAIARRVLASFEERKRDLETVVAQKKAVAQELLSVRRAAQVRPNTETGILDVVYIRPTDPDAEIDAWPPENYEHVGYAFRLDANDESLKVCPEPPSAEQVATWPHAVVLLEVNKELPGPLMEVIAEVNEWLERYKAARATGD